ncbi:ribose 5-phosphate isomerase A [Silvibacterium bohemicum]|uniref:Ribose-5-phosphate isomerase A n=1 Tax=Silvibacterium bohemicum TaxID=1577686 RepID=A0A841JV72_9BACT|nr:ribose-5-phosphate isomerase RpiA [Silvibacterium bohemicum]MBB6144367.1 ribose 5-phosphate isomerase A [Silvibacterium bohemicum]
MTGMTQDDAKLLAAKRAVEFISDGMKVGLGTGTTTTLFIHELGKAVQSGLRIEAIATSDASATLAKELGIPLTNFNDTPVLDVNVDGADEIAPRLALIKGGHGAHLREKIVASAARQFIVVADETKVVQKLGKFPLPVEVIHLALPLVTRQLKDRGLNPVLRAALNGTGPWITDEGNVILDCHCGVIEEPERTAMELRNIVGVVEHGLFLGMATLALVARENGVRELRP